MTNPFEEALAKLDWKGMAEAWHKGDMEWHAEEWRQLIEEQRQIGRQEVYEVNIVLPSGLTPDNLMVNYYRIEGYRDARR